MFEGFILLDLSILGVLKHKGANFMVGSHAYIKSHIESS